MIYVVLVNWNGRADTLECLESLARCSVADLRVLVVDNASADGSIPAFESWGRGEVAVERPAAVWDLLPAADPRPISVETISREDVGQRQVDAFVTVIAAGANLGFAGANNLGIRQALADPDCRYVWILNNDTVTSPDAPAVLAARMASQPSLGILGATLLFYHDPDHVQTIGSWWGTKTVRGGPVFFRAHRDHLPDQAEVERRIDYVSGASMFTSRAFLEAVGPMSEDYFLYYEELDWTRRMRGKFDLGWCPEAVVYHKEGASIGTSSVKRPSDTSLYYYYANLFRFYRKFHPLFLPLAWARWLWDLRRYWLGGDRSAARVMRRAAGDVLAGRKRTGKIDLAVLDAAGATK